MTWKAGDLATLARYRTEGDNRPNVVPGPSGAIRMGAVYLVTYARYYPQWGEIALRFDGVPNGPGTDGWDGQFFRKIEPYQTRFAEQLRTALPTKELVSAQQEGK